MSLPPFFPYSKILCVIRPFGGVCLLFCLSNMFPEVINRLQSQRTRSDTSWELGLGLGGRSGSKGVAGGRARSQAHQGLVARWKKKEKSVDGEHDILQ